MAYWKTKTAVSLLAAWIGWTAVSLSEPVTPQAHGANAAISSYTTLRTALKQHLTSRETSFTVPFKGVTGSLSADISKAIESIFAADDGLAYTVSSYRWSMSYTKKEATIRVQVSYWENAKQTEYVTARVKEIAKSIFKPGMNAHEKVKAVHDWVLLNVAYDRSLVQHSAYAALTKGVTVCQGYALLTYRLLNEGGIQNRIVEGTVSTGPHAWNLVNLDGKWYHLDTTFDDPVPDVKGRTTYGYYLITDERIGRDHRWTKTYPAAVNSYGETLKKAVAADGKKASFYDGLRNTLGYPLLEAKNTAANESELGERIRSARKAGKSSVTVRWTAGTRQPDLQALLDEVPGLKSVSTSSLPFPLGDPGDTVLKVEFR